MGTWRHMGMYCYRQNHQPKPSPSEPPCKWDESEDPENPGGCDMMWSKILLHGCWDGKLWMSQDKRLHMAHSLWILWWNMRIQPTTPNQNTSYSRLFEWLLVVFEPLIMPSYIILHYRREITDPGGLPCGRYQRLGSDGSLWELPITYIPMPCLVAIRTMIVAVLNILPHCCVQEWVITSKLQRTLRPNWRAGKPIIEFDDFGSYRPQLIGVFSLPP